MSSMGKRQLRVGLLALFVVVVEVAGVAVARFAGGSSGGEAKGSRDADAGPAWVGAGETPNARHEAADEAHQAKFERGRGKEADREGPSSPAAEQVGDRAY